THMAVSNKFKQGFKEKYGPWALITGASSGIGKELAAQLAEMGLNVILTGRSADRLLEVSETLKSTFGVLSRTIPADLSSVSQVSELNEQITTMPIGLFVASAGFGTSGDFHRSDLDQEIAMLSVNNLALMVQTHHFAQKFAKQNRGGIILMSSIVGFQGAPYAAHYAASKAFVQSLAEGLYHELRPHGVDVLAAAPGPVNSGFARVAHMEMGNALEPSDVSLPILKALGQKNTVFPGKLTKTLMFGLRTVPRWGKIRVMKRVMAGMTKNQRKHAQ
ncbi:MAG: SDR family NAD(P)-dependent oxidoreductase, partial [Bacteroidota bacterium]